MKILQKTKYVVAIFIAHSIFSVAIAQDEAVITIEDIIDSVKAEIKYAQGTTTVPAAVKIDSVDLTLTIQASVEGKGAAKGKIPVFGVEAYLEGSKARSDLSKFNITFKPNQEVLVARPGEEHPLGDMILAAKNAALHAMTGEPKFDFEKAVIELGFEVQKKKGAGFTFLFIQVGGSTALKTSHNVKLTLTSAT